MLLRLSFLVVNEVRIPANNDWVMFTLLGCAFVLIFMMISLQRDASVKEFLAQEFTVSANVFLSWLVTSFVFATLLSVLLSQFIPFVPKFFSEYPVFGYQVNKFGYTFLVVLLYYFIRAVFTYFFYQSSGAGRRWAVFYFTVTKLYFVLSLLLIIMCIINFYFPVDRKVAFPIYVGMLVVLFVFKLFYYLFHKNQILPKEWYYKFLYICTLQIIPLLVLWKLLFF